MLPSTVLAHEDERLADLQHVENLDSSTVSAFDDITLLAAQICETPIAAISFIDRDRQTFKSCIGLSGNEIPRNEAFCALTIGDTKPFVVTDATADQRFRNLPVVTSNPNIRFYAGLPIGIRRGVNVGTLSVMDHRPRALSAAQTTALEALARQVNRELRAQEFRYIVQTFVAHAPLFAALKDEHGRFEYVNESWRDLAPDRDPIGKTNFEWLGTTAAAAMDDLDRAMTSGVTIGPSPAREGDVWLVDRFPVKMISGRRGLGIIGVDFTALRDAERQLEHARRVESLGMLASTVAHEFNNVLMAMSTRAELIQRSAERDTPLAASVTAIVQAIERGRHVVDTILRYGRPSDPVLTSVDLGAWLRDAVHDFSLLAGPKIEIALDVRDEQVIVRADRDQLHQVLSNLVSNARDAMSARGRIAIELERRGDEAHLTVSDSGSGMTVDVLEQIFEPLYTTKRTGTGLGLAVARQIIDEHRGTIAAESTPGSGTTFHITLPLEP